MVLISATLGFGVPITPGVAQVFLITNILGDGLLTAGLTAALAVVIWWTVRPHHTRSAAGR